MKAFIDYFKIRIQNTLLRVYSAWIFFLEHMLSLTEYSWYRKTMGGSWYKRQCVVTYDMFWTQNCCGGDAKIKDYECYDSESENEGN